MIATISPVTGETIRTFPTLGEEGLQLKLERAASVFSRERATPIPERAERLRRLALLFQEEADRLAALMTLEMGKPLQAAREEALKCAKGCRYYADNGPRFLADERLADGVFIRLDPLGPLLAVMPWNFPFWQVVRCSVPAILAGNVILLKHAANVPQCAEALEDLFLRAGFPPGVFQNLFVEADAVFGIIDDPRVAGVTLTGSLAAGSDIAAHAGKALKPTVLELGGSDPFIVLPSADLPSTVEKAVQARIQNNGQSCIAAKRFIVHAAVYDEFERLFVERFRALRVGDPALPETEVGPLAHGRAVETLARQVKDAKAAGGRILVGGKRKGFIGFFFEPTIIAGVSSGAPIAQEEFFGPVALLFQARDLNEAIGLANRTPFGLGASVWTQDQNEQRRCIAEIEAGQIFVNRLVASDPAMPFGGVKRSGYGRELGAPGIRQFVNAKTVSIG